MTRLYSVVWHASNRACRFYFVPALTALLVLIMFGGPAQADFSKASLRGKAFCPKGTHFSPRKGGECWSCPSGMKRTVLPITGGKACKKKSYKVYKPAKKGKKTAAAWQCKGAWFWDPRKGGRCWSCEGYKRGIAKVTSAKACFKKVKARHRKAKYVKKFGCGKGLHFSLRKGGQCWACPASHKFRTINSIAGPKACTSSFKQVLAADTTAICRKIIVAIDKGSQAFATVTKTVKKVTDPLMAPVRKATSKISSQIKSPKKFEALLSKAMQPLQRHAAAFEELERFSTQAHRHRNKIRAALLNPNLVCENKGKGLIKTLRAAGLAPQKRAGWSDGILINNANAATTVGPYWAIALSNSGRSDGMWHGGTMALSYVTNWKNDHRIFFSFGPISYVSTRPGYDVTLSTYYFHRTSINRFDLVDQLGFEIGVGKGKWLDDWLDKKSKKFPRMIKAVSALPGGLSFSMDPLLKNIPGIGTNIWSTEDESEKGDGLGPIDFTGSADVTFQLIRIR